eukprot:1754175-Pleurochrysis_carterae.AAC.3
MKLGVCVSAEAAAHPHLLKGPVLSEYVCAALPLGLADELDRRAARLGEEQLRLGRQHAAPHQAPALRARTHTRTHVPTVIRTGHRPVSYTHLRAHETDSYL